MTAEATPPMPTSQAEWAAHWAFYRLTVLQRDRAWSDLAAMRTRYSMLLAATKETASP